MRRSPDTYRTKAGSLSYRWQHHSENYMEFLISVVVTIFEILTTPNLIPAKGKPFVLMWSKPFREFLIPGVVTIFETSTFFLIPGIRQLAVMDWNGWTFHGLDIPKPVNFSNLNRTVSKTVRFGASWRGFGAGTWPIRTSNGEGRGEPEEEIEQF